MNETPRGNRLHIALFGRRNVGKSSLINALTHQKVAVVSEIAGTTTDPVYKSMEVLPLGPVVFIDTPGIDDEGMLGNLRVEKTKEVLRKTDIGIIVTTGMKQWGDLEEELSKKFIERKIPFIVAVNKCDNLNDFELISTLKERVKVPVIKISAYTGNGVEALFKELTGLNREDDNKLHLIDGLVKEQDLVVLVTPIDKEAPKGRFILPQQQVLRDILDNGAMALVTQEFELEHALKKLGRLPDLVITDSQVFDKLSAIVPESVPLTSFSIVYANEKGNLSLFIKALKVIESLRDEDDILMVEGCTHHRKDDDIGTVKIPNLLMKKPVKR